MYFVCLEDRRRLPPRSELGRVSHQSAYMLLLTYRNQWEEAQQINLIHTNIKRTSKPSISMITEAGIIGKIGLNSSGVGVCINAIRNPCRSRLNLSCRSTSQTRQSRRSICGPSSHRGCNRLHLRRVQQSRHHKIRDERRTDRSFEPLHCTTY